MSTIVTSEQYIYASPARVYYALTHAIALHEWLCDFATVAPRPGGRMYLWWHGDFYSAGEYIALEENKSVKFRWSSRIDPAATEVTVTLITKGKGTQVILSHCVPDGEDWNKRAQNFKTQCYSTLPNLASVLETGIDRRTFDRPMLGITISDFNLDIASKLSIPVSQGIRLDEVRAGMGAHSAGLCKDDVIVELDGKPITNDYGSFITSLSGKKGGDKVEVVFYRGPQKMTVTMELTKRPVPPISWSPTEMAKQVQHLYADSFGKLEDCLKDTSEAEADREPAPGEWSAKQTLAHLIHTERGWISNLDDSVCGYERLADDWGGNLPCHINATVQAYGTVREMLVELRRLSIEMVSFLSALPDSFIERKASYFTTVSQMLEMESHTFSHITQIKSALSKVRNS